MEKLLPQNIEAECGVLGSIIIDPEAILLVVHSLQAHDFYRDAHRRIYDAIVHLANAGTPPDFITLCDELEGRGQLTDVGGASYITSLINQVPTSGNIEYYANIVSRTSQLRAAIHASGQTAADAYEPGANAEDVLAKAQQRFIEIMARKLRGNGFTPTEDLMPQRIELLNQLHQKRGTIIGVPTGFSVLDQMTGGLQRSDLIILAARPGMGKTSMALSLAANAALTYKQRVAIFSLEMSKEQLGDRLLSMDADVDQQRLRTGWIEDDEWERIVRAGDRIAEASLWIDDTAGISPFEMRNKLLRLQAEQGVDLVIVDYLQLMQGGTGKKYENRVVEVSDISRNLKGIAREFNVPVVALSQLSRSVESRQNKVPQLSDLRESGAIEQDADIVLFIYRDVVYNPNTEKRNTADIIAAKHRNGPIGEISLHFDPTRTRFRDEK
jgi:replicative DNA helicase